MKKIIAVLAGDGIGQEIMPHAINVLKVIADQFNHTFIFHEGMIGGSAYEKFGEHFPQATKEICHNADAILFGSVGGPIAEAHLPKWKNCETNTILTLRKSLALNVNLRPIIVYPELADVCPLKTSMLDNKIDILFVRELIGDIYFGEHSRFENAGKRSARDCAEYDEDQIKSVAHRAFQFAQQRRKKLTSIDKANVLATSKLWREVVTEIATDYPDVEYEHMLVDNCAMQLMLNPCQFDVILTPNLFGDILCDAAAALPGSLGLIPSASLNHEQFGLYEPAGGSAPDIAGKNIANPIGQILSAALLLRYSFHLFTEAAVIETSVKKVLQAGFRTYDIYTQGRKKVGSAEFTDAIINQIKEKSYVIS